jgi:hypothetical protein
LQVQQARNSIPVGNDEYAGRVADVRARMDALQARLADIAEQQNRYLQSLAIGELEAQKLRIETYQIQARYALATIYDRASNGASKSQPKEKP